MSVGGEGARGDGLLRWFCVGGIGGYAGYVTLKRGVFPLVFSDGLLIVEIGSDCCCGCLCGLF